MRPPIQVLLALLLALALASCSTAVLTPLKHGGIRYVTVEDIGRSLPAGPIVVGFDIDDTVLFSSPGFYYGLSNNDGPGGMNRYGRDPLHSPRFWNDMNGEFDKFSLPKQSGAKIVGMHRTRGDRLVFITARHGSSRSTLPEVLARTLGIAKPEVVYTSSTSKAPFMLERKVSVYYGDADADMKEASEAKARPIRVLRPALSTNRVSKYHPGRYGEEVVSGSDL